MAQLSISQVARLAGLRPSAIRYYEQIRVLAPARRIGGQRRYDAGAINRLAVLRCAQEAGFTLDEIGHLLLGPGHGSAISARWRVIASAKLKELDARIERLRKMKTLLRRLETRCRCDTVEECGAGILRSGVLGAG